MIIRILLQILYMVMIAVGILSGFFMVETTFDGYQLLLAAVVLGGVFYMLVLKITKYRVTLLLSREKRDPVTESEKLTICLCVLIFFTAFMNFTSGLDDRSLIQVQIIGKEREILKNSGYSHYFNVNSNEYGERKILVRKEIYENVDTGDFVIVHLTTSIFGYKVVR